MIVCWLIGFTKTQLHPGKYGAGSTKHRRGIVPLLQLGNQGRLPDNLELLIKNALGAFGAQFLHGIHSGFPCAVPGSVRTAFTSYGSLKQSVEGPPPGRFAAHAAQQRIATLWRHLPRHATPGGIWADNGFLAILAQLFDFAKQHQKSTISCGLDLTSNTPVPIRLRPFVRYNVDLLSGSERSHFGCTGRGSHFPNHIFRRCLCTKTASLELPTRRPLEEPLARGNIST